MYKFLRRLFSSPPKRRIALIYYDRYPALLSIIKGFTTALSARETKKCVYIHFDAQGNKDRLIDFLYEISKQDFDLIVSIGTECTRLLKIFAEKQKITAPVVFTDVKDPEKLSLISCHTSNHTLFTGIVNSSDTYKDRIEHLLEMQPGIRSVLVVFDVQEERSRSYQTCSKVRKLFHDRDILCTTVGIEQSTQSVEHIDALLQQSDIDVLFGLKQPLVMSKAQELAECSTKHQTPFFSSDLASVGNGAALGSGHRDFELGTLAAHQAALILFQPQRPTHIPPQILSKPLQVRFCTMGMKRQGFSFK